MPRTGVPTNEPFLKNDSDLHAWPQAPPLQLLIQTKTATPFTRRPRLPCTSGPPLSSDFAPLSYLRCAAHARPAPQLKPHSSSTHRHGSLSMYGSANHMQYQQRTETTPAMCISFFFRNTKSQQHLEKMNQTLLNSAEESSFWIRDVNVQTKIFFPVLIDRANTSMRRFSSFVGPFSKGLSSMCSCSQQRPSRPTLPIHHHLRCGDGDFSCEGACGPGTGHNSPAWHRPQLTGLAQATTDLTAAVNHVASRTRPCFHTNIPACTGTGAVGSALAFRCRDFATRFFALALAFALAAAFCSPRSFRASSFRRLLFGSIT